jgi:hypothetical protein
MHGATIKKSTIRSVGPNMFRKWAAVIAVSRINRLQREGDVCCSAVMWRTDWTFKHICNKFYVSDVLLCADCRVIVMQNAQFISFTNFAASRTHAERSRLNNLVHFLKKILCFNNLSTFWSKNLHFIFVAGKICYGFSTFGGRCTMEVGSFLFSVFLTSDSRTGQLLAPWNRYIKRLLMYEDRVKSLYLRFLPFVVAWFYCSCFDHSWLFLRNRDETMWLTNRLSPVSWHCSDHNQLSHSLYDIASMCCVIIWYFSESCAVLPKLPAFYSIRKLFGLF